MSVLSFIIGPIVGGAIGGFTNKVAIHMLFRPYKAHYIGKLHIPFTPGIIPKEKDRIAHSIGEMVSGNLLNSEVLSATLLSPDMEAKVQKALDGVFDKLLHNEKNLLQFLSQYADSYQVAESVATIEENITEQLYAKLSDPAVSEKAAQMAVVQLEEKLSTSILGRMGTFALPFLRDALESKLSKIINEMLCRNGQEMISNLVQTESEKLMAKPISQLCQGNEHLLNQLKTSLFKAYRRIVSENLPRILATLDIQKVVQDRISQMDMREVEKMIVDTMDKELRALVWFGVLLGFLLGFVTNLI